MTEQPDALTPPASPLHQPGETDRPPGADQPSLDIAAPGMTPDVSAETAAEEWVIQKIKAERAAEAPADVAIDAAISKEVAAAQKERGVVARVRALLRR